MTSEKAETTGLHNVIVMQSADPFVYFDMLKLTSVLSIEYCRRQSIRYEMFVGFKRGFMSWHASYNRIVMLKELLDRNYRGWAIWLDADAYIADLNYDVCEYLSKQNQKALIVGRGSSKDHLWDVNNGVFMINFAHSLARVLIFGWHDALYRISDVDFAKAPSWHSIADDQAMFQWQLQNRTELESYVGFESPDFINSLHGRFIRQITRGHEQKFDERLKRLKAATELVFHKGGLSS